MSRRIQRRVERLGVGGEGDTYFDKVLKYIPADVVVAWIAATGIIKGAAEPTNTVLWIAFIAGLAITALWIWRQTSEPNAEPAYVQILISIGAFTVWVFALGGPFEELTFYSPLYGSLLLIAYTLVVGVVDPKEA